MIQRSFSGLRCKFLLHSGSLYAAAGALLSRGLATWAVCPTLTAVSHSQLQSALLIHVQWGSEALPKISLFSCCTFLRQACKCFWSRKSQLWLKSSCHKLKTREKKEKKKAEKLMKNTWLRNTASPENRHSFVYLCSGIVSMFELFALSLSEILAFPESSAMKNGELPRCSQSLCFLLNIRGRKG